MGIGASEDDLNALYGEQGDSDNDQGNVDNDEIDALLNGGSGDDLDDALSTTGTSNNRQQQRKADAATPDAATQTLVDLFQTDLQYRQQERDANMQQFNQRQAQARQAEEEAATTRRQEQIDARIKAYAPVGVDADLTEDEQKLYNASRPVIDKLARRQVGVLWSENLQPALRALMEQQEQTASQLEQYRTAGQTNQRQVFEQQLRISVPDIDGFVNGAEFQAFKASPVPGAEHIRYGDLLGQAYTSGDVSGVTSLLKQFKTKTKGKGKETPQPKASASQPSVVAPKGAVISMSKLDDAYRRKAEGLIDDATLRKIEARFEEKASQGLVDYNL